MKQKQYDKPQVYEAKLEKVMARLGVEQYNYDWSRFECWVEFCYKGQFYKFSHSVENAKSHGIDIQYGSDVFAQVVLSLEDLARMVERGIYDLSTWVAGMKSLPAAKSIPDCFKILQFDSIPKTTAEVETNYKRIVKIAHPDGGGSTEQFTVVHNARKNALDYINNLNR